MIKREVATMIALAVISFVAAVLMTACGASGIDDVADEIDTGLAPQTHIRLRSANKLIVGTGGTRLPYIGTIGAGNLLTARVVSSTTSANYVAARHVNGEMTFGDGSTPSIYNPTSLSAPEKTYFPGEQTDPLYLTGLYPLAGWTMAGTETVATIDITGCEDVMAAAEVTTSAAQVKAGNIETLTFNHLLTKLEVKLQALTTEATVRWGKVTKIELAAAAGSVPAGRIAVDMKTATLVAPATPAQAAQAFYGMSIVGGTTTYTDTPFAEATLTEAGATVAYTMMAPINATKTATDLTFNIHTELNDLFVVSVPLSTAGHTAGRAYSITFTFSADAIKSAAEVVPWMEEEQEIVTPVT